MHLLSCCCRSGCAGLVLWRKLGVRSSSVLAVTLLLSGAESAYTQERVLGTDISYWNGAISQDNWNTAFTTGNRKFVFLRATRGGTTGVDQPQGTPGGGSLATLSHRYDDPRFVQNLKRALAAGFLAGSYHFGRPDVADNTGTDEANHFIEMAGAWMRPGYMMPVFDQEAGSGSDALAQFALDFSDRIYAVMKIRPAIYINGNYSSIFQGATLGRRNALAQPSNFTPSVVGAAYPMLWNARYSDNSNPNAIPVQTGSPKTTYTTLSVFYGPWDDYGDTEPWSFWQYASTVAIPGFPDTTCDSNVSHGDMEYVRNYLVPAVWWNDLSGDWSTLLNWNSGQTAVAPVAAPGQAAPYETGGLPTPRLPGAAGSGPTSGQYDTVILERPNANVTVTLSTGAHNVRKLYMRESLNITGGSLTVNYNPTYRADTSALVRHGGPVSAQFSGAVSLSGTGSFATHTLQVDPARIFTLGGGTLTLNTIDLMPGVTPARLLVSGNVNINPLANAAAVIRNGTGAGASGNLDLGGGTRVLTVGNGTADVDLSLNVPIQNGGLGKAGPGTLSLNMANVYAGDTTVSAGRLLVANTTGSGTGNGAVTVEGGTLSGTGRITGPVSVNSAGTIAPGTTAAIGTLTLGNSLTLAGTSSFRLLRGGTPAADRIVLTSGTLNYGGTLIVNNTGPAPQGGDTFALFSAPAFSGAFDAAQLPALDTDLNWYMGDLAVDGTLKVNRKPVANNVTVTNTPGQTLLIPFSALFGAATDLDGDTLSLGFNVATTNGVALSSVGSSIAYSNPANVQDRFGYSMSDGRGGVATALVLIVPGPVVMPEITAQPQSCTNMAGTDATFWVEAAGTPPLYYQWRFEGADIAGATNATYTRSNVLPADQGGYSVVVSNLGGSMPSAEAQLVVIAPPARIELITLLPEGVYQIHVTGTPGRYALEATSDFATWQELTNAVFTTKSFNFSDANTNLTWRAYRTRLMEQ